MDTVSEICTHWPSKHHRSHLSVTCQPFDVLFVLHLPLLPLLMRPLPFSPLPLLSLALAQPTPTQRGLSHVKNS